MRIWVKQCRALFLERSTDITSSKPSNWNLLLLPLQPLPAPTCNNSLWVSISVTPTTINTVAETRNLGDICFFSSLLLHSSGHKIQWIPPNTTLICHFSPYSSPTSCSWTCPLLPGFPQQLQAGLPALLAPIPVPQRRLWETFLLKSLCLKPRNSSSATSLYSVCEVLFISPSYCLSPNHLFPLQGGSPPISRIHSCHCLFADAFLTCLDSSPTSFSSSGAVYLLPPSSRNSCQPLPHHNSVAL